MRDPTSGDLHSPISRRDFVSAIGAAGLLPVIGSLSDRSAMGLNEPSGLIRVRAITAGIATRSLSDLALVESALAMLERAKRRLRDAGYVVQTVRVATNPLLANVGASARVSSLESLRAIDRLAKERGAVLSVGPVLTRDEPDGELAAWVAEAVRTTEVTSFSAVIASPAGGVHAKATRTAADIILALSRVAPTGEGNFRFRTEIGRYFDLVAGAQRGRLFGQRHHQSFLGQRFRTQLKD